MKQSRRRLTVASAIGLWSMLLLTLCSTTPVFAQWEYVYGEPRTRERGYNGVTPVVNCGGIAGGYIAVGYSEQSPNTGVYDSYIVRTNASGGKIWEKKIDVQGGGRNDFATSVLEIPTTSTGAAGGFIVAGTTIEPGAASGTTDAYVMQLDCNGNIVWLRTYGTPGVADEAWDITVTRFGSGPPPLPGGPAPVPGDYVVAGSTFGGLPVTQDALLFRISAIGLLVWDQSYTATGIDFLTSVIEAHQLVNVGDIVAAGGTTSYGSAFQGLAIRVDGNTGRFVAAPPQNVADHGGPNSNEIFNNVTELSVAPLAGNLVFTGSTTVNGPRDIYVVRTGPNPCGLRLQTVIVGPATADIDDAYDIIESQHTYVDGSGAVVVRLGDLVLTGEASNNSPNTEAFLLSLAANPLTVGAVAKTYGDITPPGTGIFADGGRSLADDGTGFIVCGYSTSNFLFNNDPEQLYLVKTDGAGLSGCENQWNPSNKQVSWAPGCRTVSTLTPLATNVLVRTPVDLCTPNSVCPRRPCIVKLPNNGNDGGHQGLSGAEPTIELSSLRSYPNPVKRGGAVTLEFTSSTSNPIEVTVTSALGETVERLTTENGGGLTRFSFRTDDLAAGAYIIEVSDGARKGTVRIIVTD